MYIRLAFWPLHRLLIKQFSLRSSSANPPTSSSSTAGSHAPLRSQIRCSIRLCPPQVTHFNRLTGRTCSLNARSIYPLSNTTSYSFTMSSSDATSSAAASPAPVIAESRTPFTFKLDHIKRLNSITNYLSLRNQVSIYLQVMDIYKYVD